MKKLFLLGFSLIMFFFCLEARVASSDQDSLIFEEYVRSLQTKSRLSFGELMVDTALSFEGRPYVASTLDKEDNENLVINLQEFDCTTLVENSLALSRTLRSENITFDFFCEQLQSIRYRKGIIEDYSSRLHYITDWIYDNNKKGLLTDKSENLGGTNIPKKISFMSSHPESYKQLKDNPFMQEKILEIETEIDKRGSYSYIPKKDIPKIEKQIQNGDIITFATSIAGLDYSHMGIAYWHKDKLTFIHASSRMMKVVIEKQSLYDYCSKSSNCTGISVLRPNEPKN